MLPVFTEYLRVGSGKSAHIPRISSLEHQDDGLWNVRWSTVYAACGKSGKVSDIAPSQLSDICKPCQRQTTAALEAAPA